MAKKSVKKVNPKEVAKKSVMAVVRESLVNAGYTVNDGEDYGFTKGTIIVGHDTCDIQLKPVAPKAGIDRYEKLVDEEEG